MKTSFVAALLLSITLDVQAQSAASTSTTTQEPGSGQDTPYAIVQNDANSRAWERTTYEQTSSGELIPHTNHYQEIATGLNFKNPDTGQWEESSEVIEQISGGAVAKHGQHKAIFAADLATFGAIDMEMPDGQRLQSHLVGLSYFDRASGQSVFIAEVTNSVGQIVGSNQIWYDNAFTGVKAGVRYTYTREGFEQDVVLEEQPPAPEAYGLSSGTTVLQAFTEFISPPTPAISMSLVTTGPGDQLVDETLCFNAMKIGRGRAFLMGESSKGTPVVKEWTAMEGRQFLIEEVPVSQIAGDLQSLPPSQASAGRSSNSVVNVVSRRRMLPPQPLAKAGTNQMRIASLPIKKIGFVLDYTSFNTSQTNCTFQADTTYYISGNVNLYGTNTTFEGGTVLKYTNGVSLTVNTPVTWLAGPYRPVVMVAKDDNTVGEAISGSSGAPGTSYYASKALYFDGTAAQSALNIENLRILNAAVGIVINSQSNHVLTDVQLLNCGDGIAATNTDIELRNAVFANVLTNFTGTNVVARIEHLTSDTATWLNKDIGSNLFLTNCLLAAVTNLGSCSTQNVAVLSSDTGVFQIVGGGHYYLPTNSPYRDAGTTAINSNLLVALKQKTTYPPIIYSNITVSVDTTVNPQAQRDFDNPDLGYHYDPIDYLVDHYWITNAALSIAPGTAFACYNDDGIIVTDGSSINAQGTVLTPIWFTKYSCVQESAVAVGSTPDMGECVNSFHSSSAPSGQYRFCKFSCLENGGYLLYHNANWAYSNLLVQDCEFWSGKNHFAGNNSTTATLKNNLFARSKIDTTGALGYSNNSLVASNNLFWNLTFLIFNGANSNNWVFFNNDFDNTAITGFAGQMTVNGYNGYIGNTNRLKPVGVNDVVSTNAIAYQSGPLGYFYQPTTSILVNTGSCTADLTALYHYTTTTNQVKETNSVVDIGYHYVVLDFLGNPVDTDGDGIPDYLEDSNGNGVFDAGDLGDWQIGQYNGLSQGFGLQVFTPLK